MSKKEFNAALSLGDWNPAAERAGSNYDNVLVEGHEYTCFPTEEEPKKWTATQTCAMVELDNGRRAHSMYIGSCMVIADKEALVLNKDKDAKFLCAHTPMTAREASLTDLHCLADYVEEKQREGAFPKFIARETLPTAIAVADLKDADEATKKNYADFFGITWDEIIKDTLYLPSVKRATTGTKKGQLFQSKRTLVELNDPSAVLVVRKVA